MSYPKRFEDAIESLIDAFLNDELEAGHGCRCAVGNICGASSWWTSAFHTEMCGDEYRHYRPFEKDKFPANPEQAKALKEIETTGYSPAQLARVERAFESSGRSPDDPNFNSTEDQYQRLLGVFEVLIDIEGIDKAPEDQLEESLQTVQI